MQCSSHDLFVFYKTAIDTTFKYLVYQPVFPLIICILLPMHVLHDRHISPPLFYSVYHAEYIFIRFICFYLFQYRIDDIACSMLYPFSTL